MLIEDVLTEFKRTHLEHIEDIVITDGHEGGRAVVEYFRGLLLTLKGTSSEAVKVSVKWDGAPAVVCGVNPDNGKFFVGTKSVFAKAAKVNYTKKDIANNHGTDDLGQKLLKCLVHLKKLDMSGVYQGDLLFTDEDITRKNIDGKPNLTFTPNTITYAVPMDSNLGNKISSARMGIVFHTKYSGKTLDSMTAGFGTVRGSARNVFLASAGYKDVSGSAKLTRNELTQFNAKLRMAEGSLSKAGPMLDEMSKSSSDGLSVGFRLKTFFNHYIRNTQGHMAKVRNLVDMFRDYYMNVLQAEIDSRKTPTGKQKYKDMLEKNLNYIDRNKNALTMAIASHVTLQNAKNFLVSKMSEIQSIGHFLKTSNGYRVTAPEGFVAVDRVAGAVKLVDRMEFSRANFTMPKGWN